MSLCGMGGIGKTQIAIQFAHEVRQRDAGISVFWVNGASLSAVEESYYRIAVECDILSSERLDPLFMFRVKRWLESESSGKWLMIVDNVDDVNVFLKTEDAAPLAYMPKCTHGSILYTTRDLQFATQVSLPKDIIHISEFTVSEGTTFLSKKLSSATKLGSPHDLARLSDELGRHPLAISQAAAFMDSYDLSASDYLSYFENQQTAGRLLKFETNDFTRDKGWESLYSTLKISFDRIQETPAANVLALMSFLHPDTIPVFLLAKEFTDKISLSEAISTLRDMSLISPHNEGRAYSIHRLIQISMENWLESQGSRQHFLSMCLRLLARLFPEDQDVNWKTSSILLPHAIKVLSLQRVSDENSLARAELLEKVSQYELKLGKLENTEQSAREAFQIRSSLLGSTAKDTVRCQAHLARVLWALGKYQEARGLADGAFTAFQARDPKSPGTLGSMDILALVLDSLGEYEEAEQIHRQTLELRQKVPGKEHPSTLASMNNLALVLDNQGKFDKAEQIHRQTMELRQKVLGKEHSDTLTSMNNLANVLHSQGKYEEAKEMHRQTLELIEKVLGKEHPDALASMNNLALVLDNQGKYEEAEQIHRQSLELRQKILGKEHPDVLASMNNLALVLDNQGKYEEAEQMHRQTLELRQKVLGKEHPSTLTSMRNLANVLDNQGKCEEAEQIHRQILELMNQVLGKQHPSTLASMNNLANVLYNQGKYEEAEQIHRQTLELRQKMLGKEHPYTLASMNNLALVLDNQGKYEEAEQIYRQTLELRQKMLGKEHPDILTSMNNLANVLHSQGKYEEAKEMHRQTLELRQKILGKEHPSTLASMNNLALVLDTQGKHDKAGANVISLISETIAVLETTAGDYSIVKDDKGLLKALHEAGRGLLLVKDALQTAQKQLGGRNLAGDPQTAMGSLEACNTKANLSQSIFKDVAQAPEILRFERYKAAVRQEGKGNTVEVLVRGMMNDVCDLAKDRAIKAAMKDHVKGLRDAIDKLSTMELSVLNKVPGNTFSYYGAGTQNIHTGSGNQFAGATFSGSVHFG
ncbi:hypothetical protein DL767_006670 [Monosporascus sp. MG133]|nr:hypothetical protein DL767_006670 [Monosporascus sp. MG133]